MALNNKTSQAVRSDCIDGYCIVCKMLFVIFSRRYLIHLLTWWYLFLEAAFQGMWQELGLALEEFLFAQ